MSGSRFPARMATLVAGGAGAQAFAVTATPVLTRLYEPAAFGLFGVFSTLLATLGPVAALSYPQAIALPPTDAVARGVARVAALAALGIAAGLTALIALAGAPLGALLGIAPLGKLIYLLPLFALAGAFVNIGAYSALRRKRYRLRATLAVAGSAAANLGKVLLGFVAPVPASLVLMHGAGPLLQASAYGLLLGHGHTGVPPAPLAATAAAYRDFPLYRMPEAFLNLLSQALPLVALSAAYDPQAAGYFALARIALGTPVSVLAGAAAETFLFDVSDRVNSGRPVTGRLTRISGKLLWLGLGPCLLLGLAGPALFAWVFGGAWREAGIYAAWLGPWYLTVLATAPAGQFLAAIRRQRLALALTGAKVILRVGVIVGCLSLATTALTLVAGFAVAGIIANALFFAASYRAGRDHDA